MLSSKKQKEWDKANLEALMPLPNSEVFAFHS